MDACTPTCAAPSPAVFIVVPAFNEARLIAETLRDVPAWVRGVVVVDDASQDSTAARVQRVGDPRINLVRHRANQGVGAAIRTGYAHAFARGADIAVVMAGDRQMHPDDLPALLHPLLTDQAQYVKGTRLSHAEVRARMPWSRRLGSRILAMLTGLVTGVQVTDSQCGYTALNRAAAERLPLDQLWSGYGYPNDLIAMAAEHRVPITEVQVRPVYGQEKSGLGWQHALFVIPYVLLRASLRRAGWRSRRGFGHRLDHEGKAR